MYWLHPRDCNHNYKALILAAHLRRKGENVEIKVEPEPTNPFDAKATVVKYKVDGEWSQSVMITAIPTRVLQTISLIY